MDPEVRASCSLGREGPIQITVRCSQYTCCCCVVCKSLLCVYQLVISMV
jgi:hypothetical protein